MTLIDKIKKSIEAVGVPFVYHNGGEIDEMLMRQEAFPVAFCYLINQGTIEDVNGIFHERLTFAVFFADLTKFDFDSLENEQIIDRCKRRAFQWLSSLRLSEDLDLTNVNGTQRVYDVTASVLTGFAVNVTIEEVAGYGSCQVEE